MNDETRLYSSTVLGVRWLIVEVEVDFRPMAENAPYCRPSGCVAVKESWQSDMRGYAAKTA